MNITDFKFKLRELRKVITQHFYQIDPEMKEQQIDMQLQYKSISDSLDALYELVDVFEEIYNDIPVGFITIDESGNILKLNSTLLKWLKSDRKSVEGNSFADILYCKDGFTDLHQAFLSAPQGVHKIELITNGNQALEVDVESRLIKLNQTEQLIWITCINCSDSVELEAQLSNDIEELRFELDLKQRQIDQLEKLSGHQHEMMRMGNTFSFIAHQWIQPINALSILEQSLIFDHEEGILDDEKIKEFDTTHNKLIEHMISTLHDFRQYLKVSHSGKYFEIIKAVSGILPLILNHLNQLDIDITVGCHCQYKNFQCSNILNLPECEYAKTIVSGHEGYFKQAVLNILYNASDAIQEEISIDKIKRGVIKIFVEEHDEKVVLTIEDNGGGIDEELTDLIFEPNFTTKEHGTGIGLHMTKVLIENQLKGELNYQRLISGSKFIIKIPSDRSINKP